MKTNFVRAALACAALALSTTAATATNDPIPGVDIIVQKNPGGTIVIQTHTDSNGSLTLRGLAPGDYVIEIDGRSLVAAMDKLAPAAPEKKESHSSFSLGIGGFLGGGSSHSSGDHGGAGPVGGGSHGSSHSSDGGMGVGLSVPLGGGDKGSDQPGEPITSINISLPNKQDMKIDAPYCRDAASRGLHIGFTVPAAGDWVPAVGDWDGVGMTVKISENQSPLPQDR